MVINKGFIVILVLSISFFSGVRAVSDAYNVSGVVSDNYGITLGDVSVKAFNENTNLLENSTVTEPSGFYLITGLPTGIYNFSYAKDGFETGYLEVTIESAGNNSADIRIYDRTPPGQVTGLSNDTPTQTTVNISWGSLADADYYQIFRDSGGIAYTQNTNWHDSGLSSGTSYTYFVRANDSYNNWGNNSTPISIETAPEITPPPPSSYVPPAPEGLDITQGNFWIKYTWGAGTGNVTDSYNVSVNGDWTNGTILTYNETTVGPHNWSNITIWAYNNSGGGSLSSTPVSQNTQVENNKPILGPIGLQTVTVGNVLTFTVHATDADLDNIKYGTNAMGTIDQNTGEYSWTPGSSDVGTHVWSFTASDNYDGVSSQTVTVTVNNVPLIITSSSPVSDPTTTVGTSQTFEINLNRTASVIWYVNGSAIKTDSSTISSSYTNSTAGIGVYNVTSIASDGYDSVSRTWIWTVNPEPRYDVSGYVFDNYGSGLGGVLVKNGTFTNTTSASGYYFISGLLNGAYNFSYSKTGFNTGYLTIIISGADKTNANISIFDTTPPASVSSPNTYTAVGSFFINNTWTNPSDPDFSHVWFRYINGTTLKNVTKPTNSLDLEWSPHDVQNISAQTVDDYGNINQAKVWFNATVPNNPISISGIENSYSLAEGQTLYIDAGYSDADSDTGTFSDDSNKWDVNLSTGTVSWKTKKHDEGVYNWYIKVSDGHGSEATKSFTVAVANSSPAIPINLVNTTGNFWVRYDWNAGVNTDSFNVSYNGTWYNGSATFINMGVGPHGWGNITVYGWNNTLGVLGGSVSQNTQVPNNPVILGNISSSYTVFENNTISIYPDASDLDYTDNLTFGSNITEGNFNQNNGTFTWTPSSIDNDVVYNWYINVSDGYVTNTTYFTVTVLDTTPAAPLNLTNTTGNFWINYTWERGKNTDSFKILNRTLNNNSITDITDTYFNTSVSAHGWSNITVYAYNTSSGQNSSGVSRNTRVPNNPIQLVNVSDNYTLVEGETLYIYANYSDLDRDIGNFNKDYNNLYNEQYKYYQYNWPIFKEETGILAWETVDGNDANQSQFTYHWQIRVTEQVWGTVSIKNFTVTVYDSTPGAPTNLTSTAGNFWVNHTWTGINSNTFNISGTIMWANGSSMPFIENSYSATSINKTVGPHGWSNITVYGWNNSLKVLSPPSILFSKQVPNNPPSVPAKGYPVNWLNLSNGTVTLTWNQSEDDDGDLIEYKWELSNKSDFSTNLSYNTTGSLHSEELNLSPGIYYWRVKAKDYSNIAGFKFFWGESAWNQSASPDFQIVAKPSISDIRAYVINDSAVRIEWTTDQGDAMNKVEYSLFPNLKDNSSSWNNNTNNPSFVIAGLSEKSVFYRVSSYNSSNMTAYNNSDIFNAYPLQFSIKFIEPAIKDNNLIWIDAMWGHVGKYIGVDGTFENLGPDPLNLTITETYNNESNNYSTNKIGNKTMLLGPNENLPYKQLFGSPKFEINSTGVREGGFTFGEFTFNLKLNVTVQKGDTSYTFYNNNTVISLPLYPISKIITSVKDNNGLEPGLVTVRKGDYISAMHFTLEANSSVNLSNVSIYASLYPEDQQGPYFNISKLEANEPVNTTFTYPATFSDLEKYKCDGLACIINAATFTGKFESGNFPVQFTDTEYVILPLCDYDNCILTQEPPRPKVTSTSDSHDDSRSSNTGGGSNSPGGGGGGGGGGVASGEDFNNIELREAREKDVIANAAAVYVLKSADPVMVVAFESSVSESEVPVLVEVLKNRSKFIDVDVPGKRYKYFNVFAGMSGFNTKIKNGVVVFRVNNTWLEENGVNPKDTTLYKWVDGQWVPKNTEIAENKNNYTYYASSVGNFSRFAIGVRNPNITMPVSEDQISQEDLSIKELMENATRTLASSDSIEQPVEPMRLPAAEFGFVLGVILILAYIIRRKNV